jgi:hypothetical protein
VAVVGAGAPAPAAGRHIRVSHDFYGRGPEADVIYYPYVFHPVMYAFGLHRRVAALRRVPRRFRLFFSGALNTTALLLPRVMS